MNLAELKDHWETMGRSFPTQSSVTPTSRDPYLGELEEGNVLRHLKKNQSVLDIGCGDGSHTRLYAERVGQILGMDVASSLVDIAVKKAREVEVPNARFTCGSVMDLQSTFGANHFDCVISQRCLINLPDWKHQQDALCQIQQVLKPGGLFLMTEGFEEPLEELNVYRRQFGLTEIKTVPYNKNFPVEPFKKFAASLFEIVEMRDYGAYLFFSRILHPLAVRPDQPRHNGPINQAAFQIASTVAIPFFEKCSYNLFYALRKRSA